MTGTISPYRRKHVTESISDVEKRVTAVETNTNLMSPRVYFQLSSNSMPLNFQFQATHFTEIVTQGNARLTSTTSSSVIDEETNAAVAAYATFDDVGGNAAGSVSLFDSTLTKVPMLDGEGKTAWYHGKDVYIAWSTGQPQVSGGSPSGHLKSFMTGNSVMLNVPGTAVDNTKAFCYYDSNAAFNTTLPFSVALWLYPTDLSVIGSQTNRVLFYRRIDASNSYMFMYHYADQKIYTWVNEAGVTTALKTNAVLLPNQWDLFIFTFNPTTNALVVYLNNSSASTTTADALPVPYITDTNMYIGSLPLQPQVRFTGDLDGFVFWSNKILTATEAGNMWTHGTII